MNKDEKQITGLLEFTNSIPSINNVKIIQKNHRRLVYSNEARAFKMTIKILMMQIFRDKSIIKEIPFPHRLELEFILKKSYSIRDCDNMIKLTQDSIYQFFDVDDNKINNLEVSKYDRPGGKKEFIRFIITESEKKHNKYQ